MKILVYRRTHKGDPDDVSKTFGINDCMGPVRGWNYDAVIGIGGAKPWPNDKGIKERVTWVGIGPIRADATPNDIARMKRDDPNFKGFRAPLIKFEKFVIFDENGPPVEGNYPSLHRHMFIEGRIPRAATNFAPEIQSELEAIIKWAEIKFSANIAEMPTIAATICTRSNSAPSVGRKCKK
jgi:hypothetical protein